MLGLCDWLGVAVCERVEVPLGVGLVLCVGSWEGVDVAVEVTESETEGVSEGVRDCVEEGVEACVYVTVAVCDCEEVNEGVVDCVWLGDWLEVRETLCDWEAVAEPLGVATWVDVPLALGVRN